MSGEVASVATPQLIPGRPELTIPNVPRFLHDITPEWLTAALESGGASGGATVIGYSAETIAKTTGFVNRVFRLRLAYDAVDADLPSGIVVKLPPSDPMLREVSDRLGHHRREVSFYQEMKSDPHLPAPRCYYAGLDPITGDAALLLEDMSHAQQGDSVRGCSFDEARRAIGQLASFQAGWWDSPWLEALEWMPSKESEATPYQEIYPSAWQSLKDKAGNGMPHGLRRLGDRMRPEVPKIKSELAARPRTIIHGDFRLDNCLFSSVAQPHPVVAFDWEFCVRGRGVYDAATFITESFPTRERREVESTLIGTYHSALTIAGVVDYSFSECWRDYRLAMLEIFIFWIITGGYCDYSSERGTLYLHNTLERFDAAITDLASVELLNQ